MKKRYSILLLFQLSFSLYASPQMDELIKRVKTIPINAPEKEYISLVSDLYSAGFTLPHLMLATVKKLQDDALDRLATHGIIDDPEIKQAMTEEGIFNPSLLKKPFKDLIAKFSKIKKTVCPKGYPPFTVFSSITISEKELKLIRDDVEKVFGPKINLLSKVAIIPDGYPVIIMFFDDREPQECEIVLFYPLTMLQLPGREFALSHELIHLLQDHTLKKISLAIIFTNEKNKKLLEQYSRAVEAEADSLSLLFNKETITKEGIRLFQAFLPWDSALFRWLHRKGYYNISKLLELMHEFGPKFFLNKLNTTHPSSTNRLKWMVRWLRLFNAQESFSTEEQKIVPVLPKELKKKLRLLEKKIKK